MPGFVGVMESTSGNGDEDGGDGDGGSKNGD